ncbi:MAG: winged helix-turn-helix transcriptional regulator [Treponema sp.]|nr:winged helix-turn-helix transcriptional regulator [Treponema sp.]
MTIEEIKKGETEKLEFKREIPSKDSKLMKTAVAFSNSHGGLYGGLTLEEMLQGSSSIRNELVADTFLRMGIVEKWGTGIKRIADLCREHGLGEVEYSATDFCFTSTIRRTRKDLFAPVVPTVNDGKVTQGITVNEEMVTQEITVTQHKIVEFIIENPSITQKELADKLGISRVHVNKNMAKLQQLGIISRFGSDKTGHWIVRSEAGK